MQHLLWSVGHNRILTNSIRFRRHMTDNPYCNMCPGVKETISHIFRDYPYAKRVWLQILDNGEWEEFRVGLVKDWLLNHLQNKGRNTRRRENQELIFGTTIWFLWKWRNDLAFSNKSITHRHHKLIMQYVNNIKKAAQPNRELDRRKKKQEWLIGWRKPEVDFVVINTDGASKGNLGITRARGLI